jgi:hypothetical protein
VVPIFDGSNYAAWLKAMKAFLMAQGHWSIVNGAVTLPADPALQQEWLRMDQMAMGAIILRLTSSVQEFAERYNTSQEVWNELHDRYGMASHNGPELLPSLMGEPTVRIFHCHGPTNVGRHPRFLRCSWGQLMSVRRFFRRCAPESGLMSYASTTPELRRFFSGELDTSK